MSQKFRILEDAMKLEIKEKNKAEMEADTEFENRLKDMLDDEE